MPEALGRTAQVAPRANCSELYPGVVPGERTQLRESILTATEGPPSRSGAASERIAYFTRAAVSVPQAFPTTAPVGAITDTVMVLVKPSSSASRVMVRST